MCYRPCRKKRRATGKKKQARREGAARPKRTQLDCATCEEREEEFCGRHVLTKFCEHEKLSLDDKGGGRVVRRLSRGRGQALIFAARGQRTCLKTIGWRAKTTLSCRQGLNRVLKRRNRYREYGNETKRENLMLWRTAVKSPRGGKSAEKATATRSKGGK